MQRQQNQRHLIVMSFHQCENKINGHRGLNLDLLGFFPHITDKIAYSYSFMQTCLFFQLKLFYKGIGTKRAGRGRGGLANFFRKGRPNH